MSLPSERLEAVVVKQTRETLAEERRDTVRGNAFESWNMAVLAINEAAIVEDLLVLAERCLFLE